MSMQQTTAVILAAIGVAFMLISAVGLLRLPDVFSRMHAAGKASTVGVSCLLLAAGVHFWNQDLFFRMVLLIALIFATAPISTSAMARAAYRTGSRKGLRLQIDEMGDKELAQPASGTD
ncbi:MAG: monovalent cation/H(+) antiporter subunit G [Caldilineaceae bacterium]